MAQEAYYNGLHQQMAGLAKADKPSLLALCELLGDDLSGEENGPHEGCSKAILTDMIEKLVKDNMNEYIALAVERNQLEAKLDLTTCRLEGANHAIAELKLYLAKAKGKGKGNGKDGSKSEEDQSRHKVTGIGNIYIYIYSPLFKTNKKTLIY